MKCGRTDGLTAERRRFTYVPPSLYVVFTLGCIGMILGAAIYVVTRRSMDLTVSTCSACAAAWDRASRRPMRFLLGSLAATLSAVGLAWKLDAGRVWLALGLGALVTIMGTLVLHARGRGDRVWAQAMDDGGAVLVGLHPVVRTALPSEAATRARGEGIDPR